MGKFMNTRVEQAGSRRSFMVRHRRHIVFTALAVVLFFSGLELGLRVVGFSFRRGVVLQDKIMAILNLSFQEEECFVRDPVLLWKYSPRGRIFGNTVNSLGLLDREMAVAKDTDTVRILCLGDSCTAYGIVPYPQRLQELLGLAESEASYEVINGGVFGYSSYQGLKLFEGRLAVLRPDVVTIYYGWNDHFLTPGLPDKAYRVTQGGVGAIRAFLERSRTFQLFDRVAFLLRGAISDVGSQLRVSPKDYEDNLIALIRAIRKINALPVLVTAANDLKPGPSADWMLENKYMRSLEEYQGLHQRYVEITRDVARTADVTLVDLDEIFSRQTESRLFTVDGIHLSPEGINLSADALLETLRDHDIITTAKYERIQGSVRYNSRSPNRLIAQIILKPTTVRCRPGERFTVDATISNRGDTLWLHKTMKGHGTVLVGCEIFDAQGRLIDASWRHWLPRDITPGETIDQQLSFVAPNQVGEYTFRVDMIDEYVRWFSEDSESRALIQVTVE
jgi:lysophospholipase L1-like esterase